MKKRLFSLAAAVVLLTGCSNPFGDNEGGETAVTTAPVTTTEASTDPPTTLPKKMIYFRMGEDQSAEPFLTSEHVSSCSMTIGPNDTGDESSYVVTLDFDQEGSDIFAKVTEEAAANNNKISIWYNDNIISSASVTGPINDGHAMISGLDMNGAAKITGWIYECIDKPEE